jgi:chromosomal replication initiation ATPase DnaA
MSKTKKVLSPYVFPGIRISDLPINEFPNINVYQIKITEQEIMQIVAEECEVTVDGIISLSRNREVVDARHIYCAAVMLRLKPTLEKIGQKISNRDHTTIRHALLKFMERYKYEEKYKNTSDRILAKIGVTYKGQKLVKEKKFL